MKTNLPISGRENDYSSQITIVSTTDLKGAVTHINQDFLDISGFTEEELVGKNHNVIRHPDMPPAAFADLWQHLKQGDAWMGIVNNRCKNGDNYWVDAFVGPIEENGSIVGYQSVRHKPNRDDVERADALYKKINNGKAGKFIFSSIGFGNKIFLGMLATLFVCLGMVSIFNPLSAGALVAGFVSSTVVAFIVARVLSRPLENAAKATQSIINNPVTRLAYTGRTDEVGQLQVALKMQDARLKTLLGRVDDAAQELVEHAETTANTAEISSMGMTQQRAETEQVVTAVSELKETVCDVAKNISETAQAAREANLESNNIKVVVNNAIGSINNLEKEIEVAAGVIEELERNSDTIGSVLDVISGVAEQTNLLALNAAIEAARAGEHGRGFSVVADEVRTLAGRTAESTQEIQSMIETLQNGAREAVQAMGVANVRADESVKQVGGTAESLATIAESISTIEEMSSQISTVAEQQITVVEEIERSATNMSDSTEHASKAAKETAEASEDITNLARHLQAVVHQCG